MGMGIGAIAFLVGSTWAEAKVEESLTQIVIGDMLPPRERRRHSAEYQAWP